MAKDSIVPILLIGGTILIGGYLYFHNELVNLSNNNNQGAPFITGLINKYQTLKQQGKVR